MLGALLSTDSRLIKNRTMCLNETEPCMKVHSTYLFLFDLIKRYVEIFLPFTKINICNKILVDVKCLFLRFYRQGDIVI